MLSEPCTVVIFGATGNLTQLKLVPALFHLELAGRLPDAMKIIAFARREWDQDRWRQEVERSILLEVERIIRFS